MLRAAKQRFEQGDWPAVHGTVRDRIRFYDDRVAECVARLRDGFRAETLDDATWQQVKLRYIGLLLNHKQPELAETFFNSLCCKILHRTCFHNDFIFVRPALSAELVEELKRLAPGQKWSCLANPGIRSPGTTFFPRSSPPSCSVRRRPSRQPFSSTIATCSIPASGGPSCSASGKGMSRIFPLSGGAALFPPRCGWWWRLLNPPRRRPITWFHFRANVPSVAAQ